MPAPSKLASSLPVRLMETDGRLVYVFALGGLGSSVLIGRYGTRLLRHWPRTVKLSALLGRTAGGGVLILAAPFAFELLARAVTRGIKLRTPEPIRI